MRTAPAGWGDGCYKTQARGLAVLTTPLLNKGTAFTAEERETWAHRTAPARHQHACGAGEGGLRSVSALAGCAQQEHLSDCAARPQRGAVLPLVSGHLREMIPIVNDLTVGMAMQQYHHECRRPAAFTSPSTIWTGSRRHLAT